MEGAGDPEADVTWRPEIPPPALPQPLGAGYLILVARELGGLSQRALASQIRSSQPSLATLETGNRLPTIRTLLRIAEAAGLELVLGLRRPALPRRIPTRSISARVCAPRHPPPERR